MKTIVYLAAPNSTVSWMFLQLQFYYLTCWKKNSVSTFSNEWPSMRRAMMIEKWGRLTWRHVISDFVEPTFPSCLSNVAGSPAELSEGKHQDWGLVPDGFSLLWPWHWWGEKAPVNQQLVPAGCSGLAGLLTDHPPLLLMLKDLGSFSRAALQGTPKEPGLHGIQSVLTT